MAMIKSNHISLTSELEIKEICQPLFLRIAIRYFYYGKVYNSGLMLVLPTSAAWHSHYFSRISLVEENFDNDNLRKYGYCLWSNLILESLAEAKGFYNIDNAIQIVKSNKEYFEFYGFAGKPNDPKVIDFYFNNMDFLQNFVFYFKDKAAKLIDLSNKKENRIKLPTSYKSLKPESAISYLDIKNKQKLNKRFFQNQINRYFIEIQDKKIYLTM